MANRRAETFRVIIATVPGKFLVPERERAGPGRAQIDRVVLVGNHLGENSGDLQAGRILTRRGVLAFDGLGHSRETADTERHLAGKLLQHFCELLEIARDKKLRLLRRDVERHIRRVDRIRDLLHMRLEAADRFANRGKQTRAIDLRFVERTDQAVFNCPPVEPREQRHLGRLAQILLPFLHELRCFLQCLGVRVRLLLQDREMPDRFVNLEVFLGRHGLRADLAKALQIIGVFLVDNDGGMPRRFVHDIRRRRVFDMIDLAHIARDHEHAIRLKLHERRRRNKTVHGHAAPADLPEDLVHLFDPRNAVEGNPGVEEALEVELVRIFAQEKNILAHDEAPDRVIDGGVFVVALVDGELEQMLRKRGHGLVVHRDRI